MEDFKQAMDEILNRIFPEELPDREKRRQIFAARWGIDDQKRCGQKIKGQELGIPVSQRTRFIREAQRALREKELHAKFAELVIETTSELHAGDIHALVKLMPVTPGTDLDQLTAQERKHAGSFRKRLVELGFVAMGRSRYVAGS